MQTIKTALVVVALLAALFVAYKVVNQQPIELPFDLAGITPPPEEAFDIEAEISVEAPPVDSSGPSPWPAPSATPPESAFPNAPAGIAPPAFAADPSVGGAASGATGAAPGELGPNDVRQATKETPVEPEAAPRGSTLPSPFGGPLRPSPDTPPGSESSGSDFSPNDGAGGPAPGETTAATSSHANGSRAGAAVTRYSFEQAWQNAEQQIADGQLARALLTLSDYYRNPDLDETAQSKLNERLDQLAGTVIYSRRHLLEEAYKANRGDTLHDLAARYNVSARLLQNINGVQDPNLVLPGTELKLVRGPFRAEVDLARGEATMFLGGMYAGRFAVRAGRDPAPRPGEYLVRAVEQGRTYYLPSGQTIPAGAAANPYGQWWIDLGGEQSLHGSPEAGAEPTGGCLSLSPRDAADVAAILTAGSKVVIK